MRYCVRDAGLILEMVLPGKTGEFHVWGRGRWEADTLHFHGDGDWDKGFWCIRRNQKCLRLQSREYWRPEQGTVGSHKLRFLVSQNSAWLQPWELDREVGWGPRPEAGR